MTSSRSQLKSLTKTKKQKKKSLRLPFRYHAWRCYRLIYSYVQQKLSRSLEQCGTYVDQVTSPYGRRRTKSSIDLRWVTVSAQLASLAGLARPPRRVLFFAVLVDRRPCIHWPISTHALTQTGSCLVKLWNWLNMCVLCWVCPAVYCKLPVSRGNKLNIL
jgi:hypothetical protein